MISGTGAMAIYPILLQRLRPKAIILATGISTTVFPEL